MCSKLSALSLFVVVEAVYNLTQPCEPRLLAFIGKDVQLKSFWKVLEVAAVDT
jgi:hypothetical protein